MVISEDVGLEELLVVLDAWVFHHYLEEINVFQFPLTSRTLIIDRTNIVPISKITKNTPKNQLFIAHTAVFSHHVLDLIWRNIVDAASNVVCLLIKTPTEKVPHVSDLQIKIVSTDQAPN